MAEGVQSPTCPDVVEVIPVVPKRKRVFISSAMVECCRSLTTPVKKSRRRKDIVYKESAVEMEIETEIGKFCDYCECVDPQTMVSDLDASDINSYLRSMELQDKNRPIANFLETVQKDMTANNRRVLVDWLVEVTEEYKLSSHTLYLTVSCLDRFLSRQSFPKSKLQLLGVGCMLAASKYEEIDPPSSDDLADITDNAFTKLEVSKMEIDVLKVLKWELGAPTPKTFLSRLLSIKKEKSQTQLEFLADYLVELSLLDYEFLRYPASMIAASAVFLAKLTLRPDSNPWTPELHLLSNYKSSDLRDCVHSLHSQQMNKKTALSTAIGAKYEQSSFYSVSTLVPPTIFPYAYFQNSQE